MVTPTSNQAMAVFAASPLRFYARLGNCRASLRTMSFCPSRGSVLFSARSIGFRHQALPANCLPRGPADLVLGHHLGIHALSDLSHGLDRHAAMRLVAAAVPGGSFIALPLGQCTGPTDLGHPHGLAGQLLLAARHRSWGSTLFAVLLPPASPGAFLPGQPTCRFLTLPVPAYFWPGAVPALTEIDMPALTGGIAPPRLLGILRERSDQPMRSSPPDGRPLLP